MNYKDDTVLYTIKEIMEARFKEVKEDLADIKIQTHKTNGRVSQLEIDRAKLWVAITIVILLGGVLTTLSLSVLDNKIQKSVSEALETRIKSVEYEK